MFNSCSSTDAGGLLITGVIGGVVMMLCWWISEGLKQASGMKRRTRAEIDADRSPPVD